MTVLYVLYLSLLCLVPFPAQCYYIRRNPVTYELTLNENSLTWFDTDGNGTFAWEPLSKYTTAETQFVTPNVDGRWSTGVGDVILYSDNKIEVQELLKTAELGPSIFKNPPGDKKTPEANANAYFRRVQFKEGTNHKVGYMITAPPNPDPLSQLGDLTQGTSLKGVPEGLRSEVNPAVQIPSRTEGCQRNSNCHLNVPSADVFYFGPKPTNTACLAAITNAPPAPKPPQVSMNPASVYVVYQPPQVFDGCQNWLGGPATAVTMSYPAGALSTLEAQAGAAPATKSLNVADLPCPPTAIAKAYDQTTPYQPVLVSPFRVRIPMRLIETEGSTEGTIEGFPECDVPAVVDPPVYGVWVGEWSGVDDGSGWGK
ncbi:MAG: hypothetical protein Q9174_005991 [Haloplaca sp. 1 TL-2023]